jgi:hypothetical protein
LSWYQFFLAVVDHHYRLQAWLRATSVPPQSPLSNVAAFCPTAFAQAITRDSSIDGSRCRDGGHLEMVSS